MGTITRPRNTFTPTVPARREHTRPLRDLMVRLPMLATMSDGRPDLLKSSPTLLLELAEYAEDSAQAINLGIAAVGDILRYAVPEIADGTIHTATVEALGWLLAELGQVAAACGVLAVDCRRANGTV